MCVCVCVLYWVLTHPHKSYGLFWSGNVICSFRTQPSDTWKWWGKHHFLEALVSKWQEFLNRSRSQKINRHNLWESNMAWWKRPSIADIRIISHLQLGNCPVSHPHVIHSSWVNPDDWIIPMILSIIPITISVGSATCPFPLNEGCLLAIFDCPRVRQVIFYHPPMILKLSLLNHMKHHLSWLESRKIAICWWLYKYNS